MTALIKQRNRAFDVIKCISAFLIVCIHFAPKENLVDAYINAICRVAVPMFFLITGYYYNSLRTSNKLKAFISKIVVLTISASVFYFIVFLIKHCIIGDTVVQLSIALSPKNLGIWLLLNSYPLAGHLWYLYALIYTLLINVLADKLKLSNILLKLAPALLLAHVILNFYVSSIFVRNWLFLGVPFLAIGRYLYCNTYRIRSMKHVSAMQCFLFLSFVLLFFEMLYFLEVNPYRDLYLFVIPIVIIIAILAIRNPSWGGNYNRISSIGMSNTSHIYIIMCCLGTY